MIAHRSLVIALLGWAFLVPSLYAYANEREELFRAMDDEIRRAMTELSIGDLPRPYHIEARLTMQQRMSGHAVLGVLENFDSVNVNTLSVRIRVGTPKFDNTNFFDVSLGFFGSADDEESFTNRVVPLELDYATLRRELWLALDACYKQSVELYAKKMAVTRNRTLSDTTWDFSLIPGEKHIDLSKAGYSITSARMKALLQRVSSEFRSAKYIHASRLTMEFLPREVLYANSEGRTAHKVDGFTGFEMVATTQAEDGMPVNDAYAAYSVDPNDLPSEDSLRKAARELMANIQSVMKANKIEAYSGPVLFVGQAAAEVFAQQFAPNLVAQRSPLSEGGFGMGNSPSMAFQNKIGARVLPEFMSVHALPSAVSYEDRPVAGHYEVDDEGFPARNVELVQAGYLRSLLTSRVPTRRAKASNGHCRNGGAMLSVLQVECLDASRTLSADSMRARLLKLVKDRELEYGIIVSSVQDRNLYATGLLPLLAGASSMSGGQGIVQLLRVEKLYPDGRTEPIRGVEAAGFSAATFKDILATGSAHFVHNYLAPSVIPSYLTGGSGYTVATIITPDLLFEDVEIRPIEADLPKLPLLASPLQ